MKDILANEIILEDMEDIYYRDTDWQLLKNQTVFITGATGMLASYVVYFLLYLNEIHHYNVRILAQIRNPQKAREIFGTYIEKKYFSIILEDICKPFEILEPADYVIHAASLASSQYYETMPVEVALPNAVGTYYLLEYANRSHSKSFLYFSSGEVYGKVEGDFSEDIFGTLNPLESKSCYGESKRMGETWCMAFAKEKQVSSKIVRIGHTYGPTMDIDNDSRVFSSFMKNVFYGQDILMRSDGSAKRPFCYIADAAAAFFAVLLYGKIGEAYNVCNIDEILSVRELANMLAGLKPKLNLNVICQGKISEISPGKKDDIYSKPLVDKIRSLGWTTHFNAKQGFARTLKYLEQMKLK